MFNRISDSPVILIFHSPVCMSGHYSFIFVPTT